MPARSISTGTISFGLVTIPVKLYSATQPSAGISFHLLHAKDGSRLRQQYLCALDGEKVEREEMVKGYEFAKDRYVTFTPEELKALEETASNAIEIAEFVPLEKVDPIYFDKPYYLGPDRGGDKAYRLLAEALRESGKAALARHAARGKGYLVLIRPLDGRLVLQQLLYADEIRPFADIPVGDVAIKDAELQLALRLIEQTASAEFHPESYRDEVRARTLEAIERKVAGQEISLAPATAPQGQVIDLLEALKASLATAAPARAAPAAADAPPADQRKPPRRARREAAEEPKEQAAQKKPGRR
jgi:DNA end-binding protein Ku